MSPAAARAARASSTFGSVSHAGQNASDRVGQQVGGPHRVERGDGVRLCPQRRRDSSATPPDCESIRARTRTMSACSSGSWHAARAASAAWWPRRSRRPPMRPRSPPAAVAPACSASGVSSAARRHAAAAAAAPLPLLGVDAPPPPARPRRPRRARPGRRRGATPGATPARGEARRPTPRGPRGARSATRAGRSPSAPADGETRAAPRRSARGPRPRPAPSAASGVARPITSISPRSSTAATRSAARVVLGELFDARGERALDVRRDRHQPVERRSVSEPASSSTASGLPPLACAIRSACSRETGRREAASATASAGLSRRDLEHGEPGRVETAPRARSQTDQHGDVVGVEPPKRERERRRRRVVQPLGVVDHEQERRVACVRRQQAQRRGADREPIALRRRAHRQRALERPPLAIGKIADRIQERPADVEQRAKRHRRLRLDTDHPDHPHPVRARDGVVQERGLARRRPRPRRPARRCGPRGHPRAAPAAAPARHLCRPARTQSTATPAARADSPYATRPTRRDDAGVTPTRAAAAGAKVTPSTAAESNQSRSQTTKERTHHGLHRVARISMFIAALARDAAIGAPSASADPPSTWTTNDRPRVHTATRFADFRRHREGDADEAAADRPEHLHSPSSGAAADLERRFRLDGRWIGALAAAGASAVVFGVMFDVRRRRQPSVA